MDIHKDDVLKKYREELRDLNQKYVSLYVSGTDMAAVLELEKLSVHSQWFMGWYNEREVLPDEL